MVLLKDFFSIKRLGIVFAGYCLLFIFSVADAASVVARPTAAAVAPVSRANATLRVPSLVGQIPSSPVVEEPTEVVVEPTPDKSGQFRAVLERECANVGGEAASELAGLIQAQRDAFAAADRAATVERAMQTTVSPCDTGLRECMQRTCGNDWSKCFVDGDTELGRKMDACRRDTECTSREYTAFTNEIRLDIAQAAKLSNYKDGVASGVAYNQCIVGQCGNDFTKCVNRNVANNAVAYCNNQLRASGITNPDASLGGNMASALTQFRTALEVNIKQQEERLYVLRNEMHAACGRLGAMFDDRTLDCVFTVNLWTGISELEDSRTPTVSQKRYAGDAFTCTTDWFGVDVTTHMENAYRRTREQTAASSQFMGAGLGAAAGALTSGAIDRAIDTQRAERAVDDAETPPQEQQKIDSQNARRQERQENQTARQQERQEWIDEGDSGANRVLRQIAAPFRQAGQGIGEFFSGDKATDTNETK